MRLKAQPWLHRQPVAPLARATTAGMPSELQDRKAKIISIIPIKFIKLRVAILPEGEPARHELPTDRLSYALIRSSGDSAAPQRHEPAESADQTAKDLQTPT
jgi:hypothetical protein